MLLEVKNVTLCVTKALHLVQFSEDVDSAVAVMLLLKHGLIQLYNFASCVRATGSERPDICLVSSHCSEFY